MRLPSEAGTLGPGDYVWNPGTGEVHIGGEHVTDDIVIRADADKLYEITVSCIHVSADVTSVSVMASRDRTEIRFTPERKYGLPEESGLSVTGQCDFTYDSDTGVLLIENAAENISVRAEGSEIPHTITFDPDGGKLNPGEENGKNFSRAIRLSVSFPCRKGTDIISTAGLHRTEGRLRKIRPMTTKTTSH